MCKALACIVLVSFAQSAFAYDRARAADNLAHEAAECGAYFLIASAAPRLDANLVNYLRAKYDGLLDLSVKMTEANLTKARFELATKSMLRDLNGNWSNFSILNNKYGYPCADIVKDPEARVKYWLEKKDE